MKKSELKQIIKEELDALLIEQKLYEDISQSQVIDSLKQLIKKGVSTATLSKKWHELQRLKFGERVWNSYWENVMKNNKSLKDKVFNTILNTGFQQ